MKVLGTNTSLPSTMLQNIRKLSDKEFHHNQFRVVCRCKGIVDGNKKCELAGLGSKIFSTGYTSITGYKIELELCKTEDIWICIDGTLRNKYVSVKDLQ